VNPYLVGPGPNLAPPGFHVPDRGGPNRPARPGLFFTGREAGGLVRGRLVGECLLPRIPGDQCFFLDSGPSPRHNFGNVSLNQFYGAAAGEKPRSPGILGSVFRDWPRDMAGFALGVAGRLKRGWSGGVFWAGFSRSWLRVFSWAWLVEGVARGPSSPGPIIPGKKARHLGLALWLFACFFVVSGGNASGQRPSLFFGPAIRDIFPLAPFVGIVPHLEFFGLLPFRLSIFQRSSPVPADRGPGFAAGFCAPKNRSTPMMVPGVYFPLGFFRRQGNPSERAPPIGGAVFLRSAGTPGPNFSGLALPTPAIVRRARGRP